MDNYIHVDFAIKCMCCDVCKQSCSCGEYELQMIFYVTVQITSVQLHKIILKVTMFHIHIDFVIATYMYYAA